MATTGISKAVLITGCSTGIGRATALLLAERGYPVYATARRLDAIADLATKGCRTLQLDVCDEASMAAAVQTIEASEGAVGVLVNNAGYGLEGAFETTPMSEVRRQFETNVFGLIRLTQLVLPKMRAQRWGRIVNLSSVGGKITLPGGAYYHATKHAVEAMSDALRFEVSGFGIDVVIIEPGAIKTSFGDTGDRVDRAARRRTLRVVQRASRREDQGRVRRAARTLRGRADRRGAQDRARHLGAEAAHALPGDGGGAPADAAPADSARPRLRRLPAHAVQAAAAVRTRASMWTRRHCGVDVEEDDFEVC
jgi:short-subunit dehydrogenase